MVTQGRGNGALVQEVQQCYVVGLTGLVKEEDSLSDALVCLLAFASCSTENARSILDAGGLSVLSLSVQVTPCEGSNPPCTLSSSLVVDFFPFSSEHRLSVEKKVKTISVIFLIQVRRCLPALCNNP